jgi:hypothetical protein
MHAVELPDRRSSTAVFSVSVVQDEQRTLGEGRSGFVGEAIRHEEVRGITEAGSVVDYFTEAFAGGAFDGLAGEPARVAGTLRSLERFDVDRVTTVTPLPGTPDAAAPHLALLAV